MLFPLVDFSLEKDFERRKIMDNLALLFPGQGTQYIKMGEEVAKKYQVAARVFEEANDILGFDLKNMIFNGNMEELTHSAVAQPAVVTTSYALFKAYLYTGHPAATVNPAHSCWSSVNFELFSISSFSFQSEISIFKSGKVLKESFLKPMEVQLIAPRYPLFK